MLISPPEADQRKVYYLLDPKHGTNTVNSLLSRLSLRPAVSRQLTDLDISSFPEQPPSLSIEKCIPLRLQAGDTM